jgi:hypothetical protein
MCLGGGAQQQGPTADQVAQAEINTKMWDYYQKNYKPALDKYIASRTDPKTTVAEKNKVAGQVNADVMKSVRPQSVSNSAVNAKNLMTAADVKAAGTEDAKAGVDSRQAGEEQNIVNIGRGQTTKAMAGMDEMASMSVDKAIKDQAREDQVSGMEENALGSAAGAAVAFGAKGATKPKTLSNPELEYTGMGSLNYQP